MSEINSQLFKHWMTASGKSSNTASNYVTGVNTVSKHYGRDVFAVSDLIELDELYRLYGPGGEHSDIGASNSGNVRSGLWQWLEYQRDYQSRSGHPIPGYTNDHITTLLTGRPQQQHDWFWMVVRTLRARWPAADHYTTNTKPPDVRVGQKPLDMTNGKVAFRLRAKNAGLMTCDVRDLADHLDQLSAQAIAIQISSQDQPAAEDVERWLDSVTKVIPVDALPLKGEGRMPSAYQSTASTDDATHGKSTASTMSTPPLNQILFGPPGTGKTYATINHTLGILDPQCLRDNADAGAEARSRLKARFDELVSEGRARFVTFHQSFSYEDFVEGLRADSDGESAQIEYRVEPGVFKQLCDDARTRGGKLTDDIRDDPRIWKISINGSGASATKTYCLEKGEARIGWGGTGDLRDSPDQNAYYQALGSGDKGTLSYFVEQMAVGDILLCIHSADMIGSIGVVTGDYRYEEKAPAGIIADYQHVRPVRWLYRDINLSVLPLNDGRQFTLKTVYAMNRFTWADLLGYLQQQGIQPVEAVAAPAGERKPYVLIIDEINRGNVSRIFGELITLIEESKREGAPEALSVKLPYSKKSFSVPENVYLLGTMNTADRSLAGLDIALRRRFVFHEMPPRPELLKGVDVAEVNIEQLLRVMNQRIEVLLDRDHCLGHAYFMPLKADATLARLESIFRNQILPLLQEYFFEDWQRIQWVLNDHRKPLRDRFVDRDNGHVATLFGDIPVPTQGGMWRVNDAAFKRVAAYAGVIAVNVEAEVAANELDGADA